MVYNSKVTSFISLFSQPDQAFEYEHGRGQEQEPDQGSGSCSDIFWKLPILKVKAPFGPVVQ